MAWSAAFIAAISASRIYPIYVLESLDFGSLDRNVAGENLKLSSAPVPGYQCVLTRDGSSLRSGQLTPREWSHDFGEFTVGLLDQALENVRGATARGQIVQLRMGFPGWSVGDFEPVAIGVVQDVAMQGGRWTIRVKSVVSSVVGRWDRAEGAQSLFRQMPVGTEITSAYAAGDTTLEVTTTSGAERETGGLYLLRVTPDTGDPFLLTASGTAAGPTRFTGVSASAILGTTAATASAGNAVEVLAFVEDHPFEAIRKVLVSTGTGTNGAHDTLPESWGLNLDESLLDHTDIDNGIGQHEPAGTVSPTWSVWADAEQEDALGWIQSVLAPMGAFLCERQGLLTIRGACGHFAVKPTPLKTWDIDDNDLVEVESISSYDPSQPVEYSRVRIVDARGGQTDYDGSDGEGITTRPALARQQIALDYVDSDRTAWREHVRDAIAPYYTRIGQPVVIVCRGWRMAQAAPGDHMQIHTDVRFLSGRQKGTGSDISDAAPILITAVEPDWFGATTRLRGVFITADAQG